MKPAELYDLAREAYKFIDENPLVSRAVINSHFRTTSDDRKNKHLSDALESLLARLYVFKYTDEGTVQTFFWSAQLKDPPYEPDDEPTLDYLPIDCFGPRPVDAPLQEEKGPVSTPYEAPKEPPAPEQEGFRNGLHLDSKEFKAMQAMHERVGGRLKPIYERMMNEPLKLFSKADEAFSFVGDHVQRAMMLGRMFGLGYIRRLKDPVDKTVSYYTLFGACPPSLVEDSIEFGKAALKRKAAAEDAARRQEQINNVRADLEARKEPPKEEPPAAEEEEETEVIGEDATEEEQEEQEDQEQLPAEDGEQVEPACYLSNTGEIFIRRKDNSTVDLDAEESAAVLELFRMMNPIVLDQLVERVKAKAKINKE